MFDSHIHTQFSTDSKMKLSEAIKETQKFNIGVIVTEHMELGYPKKNSFVFDSKNYFSEYEKYRSKNVFLGVEIGLKMSNYEENKKLINENNFDFVIGSIHTVNEVDVSKKEFYQNKSKLESYNEYFDYALKCLNKYDCFDSLGHIDYIARYSPYEDKEMYYEMFSEKIDDILLALIKKGKILEINTKRLFDKTAINNMLKIYKRYYNLGGKYVTIGSDAHCINNLCNYFDIAQIILDKTNLKPVHFEKRILIEDKQD